MGVDVFVKVWLVKWIARCWWRGSNPKGKQRFMYARSRDDRLRQRSFLGSRKYAFTRQSMATHQLRITVNCLSPMNQVISSYSTILSTYCSPLPQKRDQNMYMQGEIGRARVHASIPDLPFYQSSSHSDSSPTENCMSPYIRPIRCADPEVPTAKAIRLLFFPRRYRNHFSTRVYILGCLGW